jgi:hypothetical protein
VIQCADTILAHADNNLLPLPTFERNSVLKGMQQCTDRLSWTSLLTENLELAKSRLRTSLKEGVGNPSRTGRSNSQVFATKHQQAVTRRQHSKSQHRGGGATNNSSVSTKSRPKNACAKTGAQSHQQFLVIYPAECAIHLLTAAGITVNSQLQIRLWLNSPGRLTPTSPRPSLRSRSARPSASGAAAPTPGSEMQRTRFQFYDFIFIIDQKIGRESRIVPKKKRALSFKSEKRSTSNLSSLNTRERHRHLNGADYRKKKLAMCNTVAR